MAAYQLYDTGLTVAKEDELLSLSTCEYSSTIIDLHDTAAFRNGSAHNTSPQF